MHTRSLPIRFVLSDCDSAWFAMTRTLKATDARCKLSPDTVLTHSDCVLQLLKLFSRHGMRSPPSRNATSWIINLQVFFSSKICVARSRSLSQKSPESMKRVFLILKCNERGKETRASTYFYYYSSYTSTITTSNIVALIIMKKKQMSVYSFLL